MNITIENCNNLDAANISIADNKLNIKFAPNGSGKSTVARAILLGTIEGGSLDELIPFKLRNDNPENKSPKVSGLENLRDTMCFNEEYVNQFVFRENELLSSSFDILIRNDAYKEKEQEIEDLVAEIKTLFTNNKKLDNLILTLAELGKAFKLTKSGISKASSGMKGLAGGNKIKHIPAGLESYQPFIQSENGVAWVDWQTKGYDYVGISDNCPFCTSDVAETKEQIKSIGLEYDKNTIKNLVAIIDIIDRMGDYFSAEAKDKLAIITTLQDGLEKEHEDFLVDVKKQIDTFIGKLESLKGLSCFQFDEGENVADKLQSFELDLNFLDKLDSDKTKEAIEPINASLAAIIEKAGQLQGKVNQQRIAMQRLVEKHQNDINNFLSYAGYNYKVEIFGEGESACLKLLHVDHPAHLVGGSQHLSFGERNAFAIVLFMYECLSKKPGLVILDDPISSFDKNKKYAILEMLFRRDAESCLKNKTVLMLTHDVEPVIDMVKTLSRKFGNQTSASFLKLARGQLSELVIERNEIQTFSQICSSALKSDKPDIIKLIYLRRKFETLDDKGDAYQVLSNLLHKRERAKDSREPLNGEDFPEMEVSKFQEGCLQIENELENFSYDALLNKLNDLANLKSLYLNSDNGYEKLQICRLIDHDEDNPVIEKFIKETYHIENEFVCQLDPAKFDTIPEYVISACDDIVASALI
jgi:energy-coupling factor transporter ATP-binding protein EcfA2